MVQEFKIDEAILNKWINDKLDVKSIQEKLAADGLDEDVIAMHVTAFRKQRIARRQFIGFIYLAAGAFLGFISCVLTLINPVPSLYELILYGLTSVAILIIMVGLYYVFE